MDDRKYYELTEKEISERAKLTPKEQAAVHAVLSALKALPKNICIVMSKFDEDDKSQQNFGMFKRVTKNGSARMVASIRKKSLSF